MDFDFDEMVEIIAKVLLLTIAVCAAALAALGVLAVIWFARLVL